MSPWSIWSPGLAPEILNGVAYENEDHDGGESKREDKSAASYDDAAEGDDGEYSVEEEDAVR